MNTQTLKSLRTVDKMYEDAKPYVVKMIFSVVVFVVVMLFSMAMPDVLKVPVYVSVLVMFFGLAMAFLYIVYTETKLQDSISRVLFTHYESFSLSELKELRNSPEVDKRDQQLITQYLNRTNPGWSLN